MDWNGKVVLITGSSIGIGRKMAALLLKRGASVALNARNADRLNETLQEFQQQGYDSLFAAPGDVSSISDCARVVDTVHAHFGKLDVVINNAGVSAEGDVADLSPEIFQKVTAVNYLGSIYITQKALPYLRASKGSLMFISSIAAIRGIPGHGVYSASKMALTAVAESLRTEEEGNGVHIGIAYVGFTENDPQKAIYDKDGTVIPQPSRDFIRQEPVAVVAERIIHMVEHRQFKKVFTLLGKLNAIVNRFLPGIAAFVLKRSYHKRKQ